MISLQHYQTVLYEFSVDKESDCEEPQSEDTFQVPREATEIRAGN